MVAGRDDLLVGGPVAGQHPRVKPVFAAGLGGLDLLVQGAQQRIDLAGPRLAVGMLLDDRQQLA
jgi:hypothetical protein